MASHSLFSIPYLAVTIPHPRRKNNKLMKSSKNDDDYERLEFFGDAVLYFLVAMMYYRLYPKLPPGQLTDLRYASVSNKTLARATVKHGFDRLIIPSEHDMFEVEVRLFKEQLSHFPSKFTSMFDTPMILADVMEGLVGAFFIDSDSSITTTLEVLTGGGGVAKANVYSAKFPKTT
ncbi:hypothetical protein OSB04_023616 [Centaurea solstitialis]|uniref:RNase III domain-containing protein n=1 Tax=Centaurea solstitialis TaxID=347529 RepID=A0AA38SL96_9ASTR|nr:hypothetical protein OSB04_023616 [Centaurea solstitialis]